MAEIKLTLNLKPESQKRKVMNHENDKPKKDDWVMTMPQPQLGKEKGADNFPHDFAPPPKSSKQSQTDNWETIPPDSDKSNSQPVSSDFDKITPNRNIPNDVRQDETPPTLNQPPTEDWEMIVHNISISREGKPIDWEVTIPPVYNPKQKKKDEKKDDWSMPEPIFRVSEGEGLEEVAKRAAVFNLKDIEDFGKTSPDFNFSEVSPPELSNQTAPNLNFQPKPNISDSFPAGEIAIENKSPVPPNNYKTIFIVGLFSILLFAGIVLFGIYLLSLNDQ